MENNIMLAKDGLIITIEFLQTIKAGNFEVFLINVEQKKLDKTLLKKDFLYTREEVKNFVNELLKTGWTLSKEFTELT